MGATIVGVGPWTNLALLEVTRPGLLDSTQLIVLGGYVRAVGAGLPAWEPDMDYNVQQDTLAARIV
jgi:purine nucleosidase